MRRTSSRSPGRAPNVSRLMAWRTFCSGDSLTSNCVAESPGEAASLMVATAAKKMRFMVAPLLGDQFTPVGRPSHSSASIGADRNEIIRAVVERTFGPYEVVARIGAGGMGEVFKARDRRLDRIVALKTSRE